MLAELTRLLLTSSDSWSIILAGRTTLTHFLSHLDYQGVPYLLLITEKLMNIKLPDKCKHLIV